MHSFHYDAVIVGAGPAGLACALAASGKGLRTALADNHTSPGAKLSLAGGGKGNFTNRILDDRRYVGSDLTILPALLKEFDCRRVLKLLEWLDLPYEERDFGQIFGLKPAKLFSERLADLCLRHGVDFFMGHPVNQFRRTESGFSMVSGDAALISRQLVIATGSPACPASGSSGRMLHLAASWGHRTEPFSPALVPFSMPEGWLLEGLDGISLNVRLGLQRNDEIIFPDPSGIRPLLFTRTGISGPAVLVLSCFRRENEKIIVDFLPENSLRDLLDDRENSKLKVKTLLRRHLPARLAEKICPAELASRQCAQISRKDRSRIEDAVHRFPVMPNGSEGLAKAEVCRGGVSLCSLKGTLESRIVPGLFFCGEIVDVTGILGGYNIHWALASGSLAGSALHP